MASSPYEETVYHVNDYDSIENIKAVLAVKLCESHGKIISCLHIRLAIFTHFCRDIPMLVMLSKVFAFRCSNAICYSFSCPASINKGGIACMRELSFCSYKNVSLNDI